MTPDVVNVKALQESKLEVEFADGSIRLFDLNPFLQYPAFSSLRDKNLFSKPEVCNGTVTWNKESDISPDTLYMRSEVVNHGDAAKVSLAI